MTRRARDRWAPVAALALAVYMPLLVTAPGRVGADTKSYLYLDPDRMLSRAWSMWDANIGLGTVTHQNLGYLWPMGPWFWLAEHAGLPDWVAQRLWLATILFAAGAGVLWLLRSVLGWRTAAATAAAFSYAFTPYVLTLAARISVILLSFAGLPWLVGLAALAVRRGGWRYPAAFALVVTTIGSVNATGLLLVGLGPAWWLVHARLAGEGTTRAVVAVTARIGALTVACSLWWIAGLWAQGGYGIDVLRYTETAAVVAAASNAAEVLRSLGYWFFYGGDRLGPWIEPSVSYTQRLPLLTLTYALPIAALAALGRARFRHRSFFVGLLVLGTVVAVGAHPWDDPTLFGAGLKVFLQSDAGLAMRSLPRAVPLVALGVAAGLGAGVGALADAAPRLRRAAVPAATVVAVAAYAALPPLWTRGMVAENLDRPEDLPQYWDDVAAYLDGREDGTRILELPGSDFASYRWGNTVDPVTPGLLDRPYAARELIPYGSPPSADLLNALDRRIQERILDPGALAVLARLLGVGDIVLRDDLQFERYRTPRPYVLAPALRAEPDLEDPTAFGAPAVNTPVTEAPLLDELALLADDGEPRPPVEVFAVTDDVAVVRLKPAAGGVVVSGDGEGLVDVASTGLLRGDELVRYAASLGEDGVVEAVADGAILIVTDGDRRQGRRWSTVRDTLGFVEPVPTLDEDLTDNRLPVFDGADGEWQTVTSGGAITATATSYGNPISFTPEFRPANAVDGDLATEWRTGASSDVRGERLEIDAPGTTTDEVRFVQQLTGDPNRHITEVELRFDDGGPSQRVALDDRSLTAVGQDVLLDGGPRTFDTMVVEIVAESSGRVPRPGRPVRYSGLSQVGFAEVDLGAGSHADPTLVVAPAATAPIAPDTPVAVVLSRWRSEATEAVRRDPEPALNRRLSLPVARDFTLAGDARLSADAPDDVLDRLVGATGPRVTSSSRLVGAVVQRGSAALDGDPATWWSPAFGDEEPALTIEADRPLTFDHLDLDVVDDGRRSVPTRLRVEVDGTVAATVDVPAAGGRIDLAAPVTGRTVRLVIEAMAGHTTTEWFSGAPVVVPPAIAEVGLPGISVTIPAGAIDTGCREDLLTVDGEPVPIRVRGDVDPLGRVPMQLVACDADLGLGRGWHELATADGAATGIDVDRLVLRSGLPVTGPVARAAGAPGVGQVTVLDEGRASMDLRVEGATPGEPFWLVLGQSHNAGWTLGGEAPELVDGFANGWLVTPESASFDLHLEWRPQRVVNLALALSVAAVLGCVLLLFLPRGYRRSGAPRLDTAPAPAKAAVPGAPGPFNPPIPPGAPEADPGPTTAPQPVVAAANPPIPSGAPEPNPGPRSAQAAVVGAASRRFSGLTRPVRPDAPRTRPTTEPAPGQRRWPTWAVAAVLGVGTFVFAGLAPALIVAAATAAADRSAAAARVLRWAPAAGLAVSAAYIVGRQAVSRPTAAFEWPAEQAAAHGPALTALGLLVAAVVVDRRRYGPQP